MATFITSKEVGQLIGINCQTSTGYWKYNHNGLDSSVFENGGSNAMVENSNGEFTLISCDVDGNVSGDITYLSLDNNQITSFDGSVLSGLTYLSLNCNQLTSFSGTGLINLQTLIISGNYEFGWNQLTSFDATDLGNLTTLYLVGNKLRSFDASPLTSISELTLTNNALSPEDNDLILSQLADNGLSNGSLITSGGRTISSVNDYNTLTNNGWSLMGPYGYEFKIMQPKTFVVNKQTGSGIGAGDAINIGVRTSTGYWKWEHDIYTSIVQNNLEDSTTSINVTNLNGEFSIISCDGSGNASGDITYLSLDNNQITSFDGSVLSGLTDLRLNFNELTSFDGNGLSSLSTLELGQNQLTSFDGTGLSNLTYLNLYNNQLTSFDGTGLSSLTGLNLAVNPVISFNGVGLSNLVNLILKGFSNGSYIKCPIENFILGDITANQLLKLIEGEFPSYDPHLDFTTITNYVFSGVTGGLTPYNNLIEFNDSILDIFVNNNPGEGVYPSVNGATSVPRTLTLYGERSSASDGVYNTLIGNNWTINMYVPPTTTTTTTEAPTTTTTTTEAPTLPVTFITSKPVGQSINIWVQTSVDYWKYKHNGLESSVFSSGGWQNVTITNANGEFTIIPCDENGNVSGDITYLNLRHCSLTSFNSIGLSGLTYLDFYGDGKKGYNYLTSFDGSELSNLETLYLTNNQLTSFDGTGLSNLVILQLNNNQLTSFNGGDMSNLINLNLGNNPLTSFNGGDMGQLTSLNFQDMGISTLTSFDGGNMSGLTELYLDSNQLTSFNGTGLSSLTYLSLSSNQLTSFDGTGLSSLNYLYIDNNLLTPSANNSILNLLSSNGLQSGEFVTSNGRTAAGTDSYDTLIGRNWYIEGADLIVTTSGKLRVKGATQVNNTTTTTT